LAFYKLENGWLIQSTAEIHNRNQNIASTIIEAETFRAKLATVESAFFQAKQEINKEEISKKSQIQKLQEEIFAEKSKNQHEITACQ
jgi:hypothetical protein